MKTMSSPPPHDPVPDAVAEKAAAWLARRDRGLSPAEQDEYLQWLRADPRHTEAVTQHAAALERMMQLYEWQPGHDSEPNPDLFKPSRSVSALRWARAHRAWAAGLAAAAALAVVFLWERPWSRLSRASTLPQVQSKPEQAPGYHGKGLRPNVSGRHPSPKQASGNCAVRMRK